MSNQNGRIYIDTSTTPPKGIDVLNDLGYVLGTGSGDVGVNYMSEAVNMFSRKKPVDWHNATQLIDKLHPQTNHPNDWFKGKNGDFGVIPYVLTNFNNLFTVLDGDKNGWTYIRDTVYNRVLDFNGYAHYARNPFDNFELYMSTPQVPKNGTMTIEFRYSGDRHDANYEIGIGEFKAELPGADEPRFDDMYLGIVIYKKNGNTWDRIGWNCSTDTLADLEGDSARHVQYQFSGGDGDLGDYRAVPMLCQYPNTGQAVGANNWVTIPKVTWLEFSVTTSVSASMLVEAYIMEQAGGGYENKIYYRATFNAGSINSQTFGQTNIQLRTAAGTVMQTITNVQNDGVAGDLEVQAGQTVYKPSGITFRGVNWTAGTDLVTFVRDQGGKARITGVAGVEDYETEIGMRPYNPKFQH